MILRRGLTLLLGAAIAVSACSDSKQSGDGETQAADAVAEEPAEEPVEEVSPFDQTFAEFEAELVKLVDECKANTSIQSAGDKYFSGYVDEVTTFTNFAFVGMLCEVSARDNLIRLEQALFNIDPVQADASINQAYEEAGLDAHFLGALEATTINLGAGLTLKDEYRVRAPLGYLAAVTFDAAAAGDSTVSFTYGEASVQSAVQVYQYTADQITAGQARYENAQGNSPSCASCHAAANGADHSPMMIGRCSDAEIVGAITVGTYAADPVGNPNNSFCANYQLQVAHSWEFTDDAQRDAVIAYLRTLPLPLESQDAAAQ